MITKSAIKHGISPRIIAEKLLSDADKADMIAGGISQVALDTGVSTWLLMGMPDYRNKIINQDD